MWTLNGSCERYNSLRMKYCDMAMVDVYLFTLALEIAVFDN